MRIPWLGHFHPPLWSWPVVLVVVGIFLALGTWQLGRAQAKRDILTQRSDVGKTPAREMARIADPVSAYGQVVAAAGHYQGEQILMDNQVWNGQVGYRVWTPLELPEGRLVLVDRGWIPAHGGRDVIPEPEIPTGPQRITGFWRNLPEPGVRFDAPGACEQQGWPRRLNYPTYAQVACQYRRTVLNGVLLLAEELPGGFPRDWSNVGLPPIRHVGYAVQWYALALAVLVVFILVNRERGRP